MINKTYKTFSHRPQNRLSRFQMAPSRALIVTCLLFTCWRTWSDQGIPLSAVVAVSVQRLNVPELVVIDQLNQPHLQHLQQQQRQQQPPPRSAEELHQRTQNINLNSNYNQPEAASLINTLDLNGSEQHSQITFECLISYDKRKDKNIIVKWHHDDPTQPIYQWIPDANKRIVAPQYRAYIAPLVTSQHPSVSDQYPAVGSSNQSTNSSPNQVQLLEAGFRLIRPTKELGGKYTCAAISSQNDDSKSKKMIVFTPPRVFSFNASRIDIVPQPVSQRDRLIQLTQPNMAVHSSMLPTTNQLPLAYRMKGLESQQAAATTISPQMYSTIDYINVSQQRSRQSSFSSPWIVGPPTSSPYSSSAQIDSTRRALQPPQSSHNSQPTPPKQSKKLNNGVKLVCDIDQVFPIPEVSIYRLAKLDGSHPEKLAKLDHKIETNPVTGLYHVQVTSILDDDELQMRYGQNEPVFFECLIALTNLELSKYADNKRSIKYRPGHLMSNLQGLHSSEDMNFDQTGNSGRLSAAPNWKQQLFSSLLTFIVGMMCFSGSITNQVRIVELSV